MRFACSSISLSPRRTSHESPRRFPFHAAINVKLTEIIAASPAPPDWHDAWMGLRADTPKEERLRVYQAVRDSGCLPNDAGFHLVMWQIDAMTSEIAEQEFRALNDQLAEIDRHKGVEDGWNEHGERSEEYKRVLEQHHVAWNELYARMLNEHGESAAAQLLRAESGRFVLGHERGPSQVARRRPCAIIETTQFT
ncbi:MAG: hypothetical protein N2C14_01000, partial [Planctomycetales bacterium]